MKPITFKESNITFAVNQDPYLPLPAWVSKEDAYGPVISCWKLTWRERLRVLWTGVVWHQCLTFRGQLQPLKLRAEDPFK